MNLTDANVIAQIGGMFLTSFAAATLVPFQSEVVFVALQIAGTLPLVLIVAVASLGNTLGAVVNYAMGLGIERFQDRRWFPVNVAQLARAQRWYARWGVWSLLMSWAPFTGGFTVVAGIMRTPLWLFLTLVAISKTGRYVILGWITAQAGG
jgi:membrane protein YqaA with SNARE-associated domain